MIIPLLLLGGILNTRSPQAANTENTGTALTRGDTVSTVAALSKEQKSNNLESFESALKSGKPTLALVYYSVACSCTAAHCAIAEAALDSATSESSPAGSVNVIKVDGYTEELADSVFAVGFIPLIVHYNQDGKETARIEWDISSEMVKNLMAGKTAVKDDE